MNCVTPLLKGADTPKACGGICSAEIPPLAARAAPFDKGANPPALRATPFDKGV